VNSLRDVMFSEQRGHLKSLAFSRSYVSCLSANESSSRCLEKDESILGGGDILSSLDGGVVGSTCVERGGTEVKPLAKNC